MITKEELIKKLNLDIEYEYGAAIQYIEHASTITGAQYQSIQKELLVHTDQEINHAKLLSEQVAYLGGKPSMEVTERLTSDDSAEKLRQDLAGERGAIERYRVRIEEARELELHSLAEILTVLLGEEEEHERDLMMALGE